MELTAYSSPGTHLRKIPSDVKFLGNRLRGRRAMELDIFIPH